MNDRRLWDMLAPYLEPMATMGTALAADVPAGFAGLGSLLEGEGLDQAARRVEQVREDLTYLPRSEGGMLKLEAAGRGIGKVADAMGRGAKAVTGYENPFAAVTDWVNREYGPEAATALHALPDALSYLGPMAIGRGGKAARKAAQAAERAVPRLPAPGWARAPADTVRGTHFSRVEGLTATDPGHYGTGLKGAERARLEQNPDIAPRSYFYTDDRLRGEAGTGPYRYQGDLRDVYNLSEDPLGVQKAMRARFTNPQDARINPGVTDWEAVQNETERYLRAMGFGGYHTPGGRIPAAVMFDPVSLMPAR